MTAFQDHLHNDPTEGFLQLNPHTASVFDLTDQSTQPRS